MLFVLLILVELFTVTVAGRLAGALGGNLGGGIGVGGLSGSLRGNIGSNVGTDGLSGGLGGVNVRRREPDKLPAPPSEAAKLSPREAAKLPALAAKDPPTDADSRRTFTPPKPPDRQAEILVPT
jgi:hypothetical protein